MNVERIVDRRDILLAQIVRPGPGNAVPITSGVRFFTDQECPLQLGLLSHPPGHVVPAHTHRPVPRAVTRTCEVLFVLVGTLRVDFYDCDRVRVCSRVITAGEVVVLLAGGHGLTVGDQWAEVWEVKQGPYVGADADKEVFVGFEQLDLLGSELGG